MGDVKTEVSRFKLQDLQKCSFSGSTSVDIIDNQQLNSSDDGVYITLDGEVPQALPNQ